MGSKKLGIFVLIEGNDDLAFFESVLKPYFEKDYFVAIPYRYSIKPNADVNKLIESSRSMKYDYLVFADLDTTKCVSTKKESLLKSYKKFEEKKIVIVKKEIESWYIAGIKDKKIKGFRKSYAQKSETVDKEKFLEIFLKHYDSKLDLFQEILKYYSLETAIQNNSSLKYLFTKHLNLN